MEQIRCLPPEEIPYHRGKEIKYGEIILQESAAGGTRLPFGSTLYIGISQNHTDLHTERNDGL